MDALRLVVFDMAGTTVSDDGQVPRAFAAALARHGLSPTPGEISAVRGTSKREAVRRFVPDGVDRDHTAARIHEAFRDELTRAFASGGVRPVPGAVQIFEWLHRNNVRVALNTGFDREVTALLTAALGWDHDVVDAIVSGDDVPEGRPAPHLIHAAMRATGITDPGAVANVGDTVVDLEAGLRAGVRWNVGVLSGAHDRATLERAPHTHIVNSVADLPSVCGAEFWPQRR